MFSPTRYLIVPLLFLSLLSSGQSVLNTKVELSNINYALTDYLDTLRKIGIPLSYSSSKLPSEIIVFHDNNLSLYEIFDSFKAQKLIEFDFKENQVIIQPYVKKRFTINGKLVDAQSGENVIGSTVQIVGTSQGTISNGYGHYSLTLEEGTYTLKYSHISYKAFEQLVILDKNMYQDIRLNPSITYLESIEVNKIPSDINVKSNIPSVNRINLNARKERIPYLFGEVDIIQNALLRPGVNSIGEDASGINIRGGMVDQNLTLMDEAIIYNPTHFFGLISIFNPESVNDVRILKGYMPASYGGRVSSVIEVRQKEGNNKKLSISGGVGIPSARVLIEGPIKKEKSSFLFSARQSIYIPSTSGFENTSVTRDRFRFQDFNLKLNAQPNNTNTVYLSAYLGNDRNTAGLSSIRNWGNRVASFRWNHLFSPRLFSNVSAYISSYNYRTESQENPGAFVGESNIIDYSLKSDFNYSIAPQNEVSFGVNIIFHRLNPGIREPFDPETNTTNRIELDKEHAYESALYFGHESKIGKLSLNYGVRYSMFHNMGPGDVFVYEPGEPFSENTITDTLSFSRNQLIQFYDQWEPRFALNYPLGNYSSLKLSINKTAQYLHLISNSLSPDPTDIWKLSDTYIPPTTAEHYSLGVYKNDHSNKWEFSGEIYYKNIDNAIQYRSGADLVFNENIETELLFSNARAYGIELYAKKKEGKLTGWISYTLSRAESKLIEEDVSAFVLENHDRLHNFSSSWNYTVSPRISISSNFVLRTGIPVTLPTDKYVFEENLIPHFDRRNADRLPAYHRLDLSIQLLGKKEKKDGSERKNRDNWVLTLYNVYARKNAFSYFYRESESQPGLGEIVQYSIFGTVIPSLTYNFKF